MGKNITHIINEPDGCQITTDFVLNVFKDKLLMLLDADEMWAPVEYLHQPIDGNGARSSGKFKLQMFSFHQYSIGMISTVFSTLIIAIYQMSVGRQFVRLVAFSKTN